LGNLAADKVPSFFELEWARMRIGFTYDLKTDWPRDPDDPPDAKAELDRPETVDMIARALESGGHSVIRIGNVRNLLSMIDSLDVDLVFNICEGSSGRNRESQVPVILELNGIPFVGADGLAMGITLDKIVAKKCFLADGVSTPRFFSASNAEDLEGKNLIGFPLIVKAACEGTSKGLTADSVVYDSAALKSQVEFITRSYKQPAIVEEFIKGTEFTVPVLGNNPPEAMPVIAVGIGQEFNLGEKFFTNAMVVDESVVGYICPADIPADLARKMQNLAVRAYQAVGCRDFGRVDFRVDEKGNPYVLEINPLPSLAESDSFNVFPSAIGSTYDQVINRIVRHACERYNLSENPAFNTNPAFGGKG
jgi:D-alanine-D-alanine ligase